MPTLLCVPIMVHDGPAALADAERARVSAADLVEFRVDEVFHGEGDIEGVALIDELVARSPLPCIVTCRPVAEGGAYDGDDAGRVALWEHLGTLADRPGGRPPRYIDVELSTYERSANLRQKVHLGVDHPEQLRDLSTSLILSAHDFSGRPTGLFKTIEQMRRARAASVIKVAWRARSLRDNLEVFEILRERDRPTIALAMGEFGLMSRVLAPKFGAFLTFAPLRDTSATAPGQPTLDTLLGLYRFRSIGPRTKVFGVIGWPVAHSASPAVHNAGFEHAGFDGVYLPLPVPSEWEHFKATLLALLDDRHLDFRGASVTIPHKQHLLRLAREDRTRRWTIDELAAQAGASNTLVVEDDGACRVLNTDAQAMTPWARAALGRSLEGVRAAVVGAGGVGRAAAAGLARAGATVVISSRRDEQAARVAAELTSAGAGPGRVVAGPWDRRCAACCELWVNATPVGMTGGPDPIGLSIPMEAIEAARPGGAVLETVYTPVRTPLVVAAEGAGLRVGSGLDLFLAQAELQSEQWVGNRPAPGLFERAARETLGRRGA